MELTKKENYKGVELVKRLDENKKVVAIRLFFTPEESEYLTFYCNGNLWYKTEEEEKAIKLYSINIFSKNIQEIIREFDSRNMIRSNGELKK